MKNHAMKSSLLLLLTAIIWGVAFVAQSAGMEHMEPLTFNAARFLLGGLVLLPLALIRKNYQYKYIQSMEEKKQRTRTTLMGGLCCGLALFTAGTLQQYGMLYTTVGKAGFITALYIVMVPILGLFFTKKPRKVIWISCMMSVLGLYLLCINESLSLNTGDVLVFMCAVVFSIHIMVIDYFSPKADGVAISCIQFLLSGIFSFIGALFFETPNIESLLAGAVPILYAGILSCGVAYTLQIVGQKGMDPSVASLILCLESVVSVLAGWVLLQETLSPKELLGCLIMFIAVVLVQLPTKKEVQV